MSAPDMGLELHRACESGNAYRVSNLLRAGANPFIKDKCQNNSTALIKAVRGNHIDTVLVLMHDHRSEALVCDLDGQGLSAFHWALILGHIDIISIMTSLNEKLLHNCDENGRSPRQICTRVRPKIQVLDFFRCYYPHFINSSSQNTDDLLGEISFLPSSHIADDKYNKPPVTRRKKQAWPVFGLLHSLWTDIFIFVVPKSSKRQKTYVFVKSISAMLSNAAQFMIRYFSGTFGKKNVEFSKFPFRSNVISCLIILFYVCMFTRNWMSCSFNDIDQPLSVTYISGHLVCANVLGWVAMCVSFFVIYFTPPQPLPQRCRDDYVETLQEIVRVISDQSSLLSESYTEDCDVYCTQYADDDSVPCTGGLFESAGAGSYHRISFSRLKRDVPYVCHRCRCRQPLRSGHCKELNRCVLLYDHYCYFVWSCIHRDNYMYFMFYIVAVATYLPIFLYSSKLYARTARSNSHFLLCFNMWVCVVWLWVLCLTVYQLQSIFLGLTTRERMKKPKYLSPTSPFQTGSIWGNVTMYLQDTNYYLACSGFYKLVMDVTGKYGLKFRNTLYFEVSRSERIYFDREEAIADWKKKR